MSALVVAIDPGLCPWRPEVEWTLRTLLHVAGHGASFRVTENGSADLYYGRGSGVTAAICLPWGGGHFGFQGLIMPQRVEREGRIPLLSFGGAERPAARTDAEFSRDIVLASFWLLTNPVETLVPRSRFGDLDFSDSIHARERLFEIPLVSIWAAALRRRLAEVGRPGRPLPWSSHGEPVFSFTHDVDYPEIIRWIEAPRAMARGRGSLAWRVMTGASHFWTFREWVDLAEEFGAKPTFYFMARQGSLRQYALGTPDDFYDVASPRFQRLFGELREAGCEIGLHASYHAHRRAALLKGERARLALAAGVEVRGNRHHYWHLDPDGPHDTLRKLATAGFDYDSSLGLEYYPGWRRGICHPFRPWHPGLRREIDIVELPPAWMDDHFDRRRLQNQIADPDACAAGLLAQAEEVGGAVIVDYHSRGMNADFYPRYGPWFSAFARRHLASGWQFATPGSLAQAWKQHTAVLDGAARGGLTARLELAVPASAPTTPLDVGLLQPKDEASWESFVRAHPERTPYHLLAWRAVTREGLGHEPYHLCARAADGSVVGALPLFLVRGLFGARLVSVPMRDRGGVLAASREAARRLVDAAVGLARDLDVKYLELKSLGSLDQEILDAHDLHVGNCWVTTRVNLSPGRDALWKTMDKDAVRWAVNRAKREGVVVEAAESMAGIHQFHALFARTRLSMGIPPFPLALFEAIFRHFLQHGRGQLLLARREKVWIGGLVSLWSDTDTFIPAYAAPQREHRKLYPSESVFWHSMEWAIERGFRCYDFGADSQRQSGLLWFKRKWTGIPRFVNYYYWCADGVRPPNFDSSSSTYAVLRGAWSRLPSAVSKPLGAWLTRHLS